MFRSNNTHLLNKNAVKLTMQQLPGAVDMDAVFGYTKPYHVEWENIKIIVKVAKPCIRWANQKNKKWFYSLKKKDHQIADYFLLFAILDGELEAVYVLPKVLSPKSFITITKLNNNVRYDFFRTDIENLSKKIVEIKNILPKLVKISRRAKSLREDKKDG